MDETERLARQSAHKRRVRTFLAMYFTTVILLVLSIAFYSVKSDQKTCGGKKIENHFEVIEDDSIEISPVKFYLYTKWNSANPQEITIGSDTSLLRSHFSKERPTKIAIHGWISNFTTGFSKTIKDAFLSKHDVNVILVDWSADAAREYDAAAKTVPLVGKRVSALIDWLLNLEANLESFHIIGFSLGAHAAGSAARHVTDAKMPFVTGLDPGKDHWENSSASLSRSDATYVEVIHTAYECLGLTLPLGHNDFYPNGGTNQPGCTGDKAFVCGHVRAFEYLAESIVDPEAFPAAWCPSYEHMLKKSCLPSEPPVRMGGITAKRPKGVFYLETNAASPFSKGLPPKEIH